MNRSQYANLSRPHIALAYPSRGTGFDPTVFGAIRELEAYPHTLCPVFYRPMPASHNEALTRCLADPRTAFVWFVENDHLLPVGVLEALLAADAPVVAAPYLLRSGNRCDLRATDGRLALVGLGCTLIRRDVFDDPLVGRQPFDAGMLVWDGNDWHERPGQGGLCGPDVYFCRALRAAGIPIAVLGDAWQVGHLDIERQAQRSSYAVDLLRCYGGSRAIPWYPPRKEDVMPTVVYLRSPGGLVIDMDTSSDQYGWLMAQGWIEITAAEAKPRLAAQAKDAEAVIATVAKRNAGEDEDDD